MKDMGIRFGSSNWAVPVIIGQDTVYEHTDIVKVDVDSSGNPVDDLYQYHEYQYTHDEWMKELGERNESLQKTLDNTKEELKNTNQTIDAILTDIIPSMIV